MTRKSDTIGTGEARTRTRQRRQIIFIVIAGFVGGMIGFFVGFFDQGDGNLYAGDWEALKLDPAAAVIIALALLGSLIVLPLYGFRMIDELKREQNLIAFTGGALAILAGGPVWAVLYAGGFAPFPHAFGMFAIVFSAVLVSYAYARWRV